MDQQNAELNKKLQERFQQLPKAVRDAITSADVEQQLRKLADTNKLHLDQWQLLENEVMLTLLGFQETEKLADNLKADLDISPEVAASLAQDVSRIVFEPIREQLERELEHPDAKPAEVSGVESTTKAVLSSERAQVAPATPPPEQNTQKAIRAPLSDAYHSGEPSSARKNVDDDPYREPPQ